MTGFHFFPLFTLPHPAMRYHLECIKVNIHTGAQGDDAITVLRRVKFKIENSGRAVADRPFHSGAERSTRLGGGIRNGNLILPSRSPPYSS